MTPSFLSVPSVKSVVQPPRHDGGVSTIEAAPSQRAAGIRFRRGVACYRNCPVATLINLRETGFSHGHLAAYVAPMGTVTDRQIERVLEWAADNARLFPRG